MSISTESVGETKDTRNLEDFYQDYMMVLEVFDKMDPPDSLNLDQNNNSGLEAPQGDGLNMDDHINFGPSTLGNPLGGGLSNGMNFGNDLQQNMVFNGAGGGFNNPTKSGAGATRMKRRGSGNDMNSAAVMQAGFPDNQLTSVSNLVSSTAASGGTKKSRPANSVDDILSHAALAKQRRRERNKVLARKTRIKKKVELEMLKSRIDHLTAENTRLRNIVSDAGIEYDPVVHDPVQGMSLADITAAAAAGVCVSDAALQDSVFALTRSGPYDGSMDLSISGGMSNTMNNLIRPEQSNVNSNGKEVTTDEMDSDNNSKEEIHIDSEIIDIDTAEERKIESTMNIPGISEEQEDSIIRCVVVEDSLVQAKIMCKHLLSLQSEDRIIKCYRTATAEKALIFLKDMGGTNADIWFIDQNLKESGEKSMKGSELISLIRGRMEAAGTTIVGITANPLTHFAEMNAAGVDVVWGKDDIENSSMTQKINRLIKIPVKGGRIK